MSLSHTAIQIIVSSVIFIVVLLVAQLLKVKYGKEWGIPNVLYYWTTISTAIVCVAISIVITQYNKIRSVEGPPGPRGPPGVEGKEGAPGRQG